MSDVSSCEIVHTDRSDVSLSLPYTDWCRSRRDVQNQYDVPHLQKVSTIFPDNKTHIVGRNLCLGKLSRRSVSGRASGPRAGTPQDLVEDARSCHGVAEISSSVECSGGSSC